MKPQLKRNACIRIFRDNLYTGTNKKMPIHVGPGFIWIKTTSFDNFAFTFKIYHDTNFPIPDSKI